MIKTGDKMNLENLTSTEKPSEEAISEAQKIRLLEEYTHKNN
jgi:hypothetical protein